MKTQTKNEIKEALVAKYISAKVKFNALLAVFLKLEAVSESQKRYYNAAGYSKNNLDTLEYDIKKLCGIKDTELVSAKKAVKKAATPILTGEERLLALDPEADAKTLLQEAIDLVEFSELDLLMPDPLPEFSTGINGTKERADLITELKLESPSRKKDDQIKVLTNHYNGLVETAQAFAVEKLLAARDILLHRNSQQDIIDTANVVRDLFVNAPVEVKTDLKLRDEFPFLTKEDCPDKFKILVADKLTAYFNYKDSRVEIKKLLELGASEEELYELAVKAVENFELNLEIYDELNYYKEHGEILGKHPIFAEDMLQEKVAKLSTVELTKRQKNLRTYISRDSKKLDKMEAGEDKDAFEKKLNEFKHELELVDTRLKNIS